MSQDQAHSGHAPDVSLYMRVFGALAVLTVLTVGVSYLHLPVLPAVAVALLIAATKAGLVAAFFMHLKGERALIYGVLGITLFFTAVLFILPMSDSSVIRNSDVSTMGAEGPSAIKVEVAEEPSKAEPKEAPGTNVP
jgi:cytochrome c oxidase subunit IV